MTPARRPTLFRLSFDSALSLTKTAAFDLKNYPTMGIMYASIVTVAVLWYSRFNSLNFQGADSRINLLATLVPSFALWFVVHEGLHGIAYRALGVHDIDTIKTMRKIFGFPTPGFGLSPRGDVPTLTTIVALLAPVVLSLVAIAMMLLTNSFLMFWGATWVVIANAVGSAWDLTMAGLALKNRDTIKFWRDDHVAREIIGS